MSTNWSMPASAARYRTARPRNARFSRTEMRTVGQTPSTRSVVLAVGGEVILAAQRLFVHTLDAAEIVCV
jgi:hypothetical protein